MDEIYNNTLNFLMNIISIKTFIAIIVIYCFILYIALIVWVIKDVNSRSESILFKIFSIFWVIIFWILWVLIYLLIRPTHTFIEKYYEEVEWNIDFLTEIIKKQIEEKNKEKEEKISKIKNHKTKSKKKKETKKSK